MEAFGSFSRVLIRKDDRLKGLMSFEAVYDGLGINTYPTNWATQRRANSIAGDSSLVLVQVHYSFLKKPWVVGNWERFVLSLRAGSVYLGLLS